MSDMEGEALLDLSVKSNLVPSRPKHHGYAVCCPILADIGKRRTLSDLAQVMIKFVHAD